MPLTRATMSGVAHAAHDSARLERTNGATIRRYMSEGKPVEGLVGDAVAAYMARHGIADKVGAAAVMQQCNRLFAYQ
jgi:hypothetical protein